MTPARKVPDVVKVRCHYCSKEYPAWRTHQLSTHAQRICDHCIDWHYKAIEFLAGRAMPGCQACGATWEFLRDSALNVETVRMFVLPKDGVYQILCPECLPAYVSKRTDLYRGTRFGAEALNL